MSKRCLLVLLLACWMAAAQNGANVPKPADGTAPHVVKTEDKCQVESTVVHSMTGEPLKMATCRFIRSAARRLPHTARSPIRISLQPAGDFMMSGVVTEAKDDLALCCRT